MWTGQKYRLVQVKMTSLPVVEKADLYGAVTPELWSVVDPTHAAHRDVPSDVQLLLEDIANLVDKDIRVY